MPWIATPTLKYWLGWALVALYYFWLNMLHTPWGLLAVFVAAHFFVWGCLGFVAMPLMRRHPLRWHWRPVLLHLLAGALFTQADITLGHWITYRALGIGTDLSLSAIAVEAFNTCFHLGLLTYAGLLAVIQGGDALRLARLRERQAATLQTRLVEAQLQALKVQLQPHFLFNTLHAISALMHYDVATADRMLIRLSELLRLSLEEVDRPTVSLEQELAFLAAYLDIEQLRFEHRLQIEWAVPEALQAHPIPPFLLQPLVENAIKYGVAPRALGGRIAIRAYDGGDALVVEVEDDAPEAPSAVPGFGIGIRSIRARLEALYGAGRHFELVRGDSGTIARLRLPLPLAAVA